MATTKKKNAHGTKGKRLTAEAREAIALEPKEATNKELATKYKVSTNTIAIYRKKKPATNVAPQRRTETTPKKAAKKVEVTTQDGCVLLKIPMDQFFKNSALAEFFT